MCLFLFLSFLFCLIVCGFWLLLLFFWGLGRFFAVVCPCVCVREGVKINICVKVKLCTFYDFYQRCERHHFNIYFVNFTFVNFTFSNFKFVYFKTFVKIVNLLTLEKISS